MSRGSMWFAIVFLAIPLAIILGVWATGGQLWMAMVALCLLLTGFFVALPAMDSGEIQRPIR